MWRKFRENLPTHPRLLRPQGQVLIPMLVGTALFFLSFISLFGLLHLIRTQAETQIRLDRCTAKATFEFRDLMNDLESINQRISAIRASLVAARTAPLLIPGLRVALFSQYLLQEAEQAKWKLAQINWISRRGCGTTGDHAPSLPNAPVIRDPADTIGEKPLRLSNSAPSRVRVTSFHGQRAAAAELRRTNALPFSIGGWEARWAPPIGSITP